MIYILKDTHTHIMIFILATLPIKSEFKKKAFLFFPIFEKRSK